MATFPDIALERGLPASPDAERSILGAILLENEHYFEAAEKLNTFDFHLSSHQTIWSAMCAMIDEGSAIDLVTLVEHLARARRVESVGGVAYIASLTEGLPRRISIREYVNIVKEKAQLRDIVKYADRIRTEALDQATPPDDLVASMQQYSFTIASETKGDTMRHVRDITEHVFTRVQRDRERGLTTHNLALTTGVDQMDAKMKGLFENEYTVLTGETGGGKTAFALQCTRKNALVGIPVLWFSKEMKGEQLTSRLFSGMSDVLTASQIRDPRGLTMFDLDEVRDTAKKINSLPIYIDDDPNLTLQQLIARGRMAVRRHAVQLIIVDFLQLVDMPGIRDATERLTEVTHGLRDLAKFEKGLHVIGLSQLTRARGFGGKQTMKDRLKGSSAIEQSCQNLIAIEMDEEENGVTDVTLNCEKQREGPKFKVKCVYDRDHLQLLPKEDRYRDVG